jgi:hypothetical protein
LPRFSFDAAVPAKFQPTALVSAAYSPVFQFLLGAFETIPAVLLLFARTRLLGALLLFPVVLNVAMINNATFQFGALFSGCSPLPGRRSMA